MLRHDANPNMYELGNSEPMFIAIRGDFPRCVQLLIELRANLDVQEDFTSVHQIIKMTIRLSRNYLEEKNNL